MNLKRILIFRIGQLGDTLVALPAILCIRNQSPSAHIALLHDFHVGKSYVLSKDLLGKFDILNDFIGYPVGYTFTQRFLALLTIIPLIIRIRRSKFDLVIRLDTEYKTGFQKWRDQFFFKLAGIPKQISATDYRTPNNSWRPLETREHETDFYLRVLSENGFHSPDSRNAYTSILARVEQEHPEISSFLREAAQTGKTGWIGIGIGSKMQAKRWSLTYFQTVLFNLVEAGFLPIFYGGQDDKRIANELIQSIGSGINTCGQLSFLGTIQMLRNCRFYLGNDTGTMHLAVASGTRCVALFSARDYPGKWYPYGNGHYVHRVRVDCEGCMLTTCVKQKQKCLQMISPETVLASCMRILNIQPRLNLD